MIVESIEVNACKTAGAKIWIAITPIYFFGQPEFDNTITT